MPTISKYLDNWILVLISEAGKTIYFAKRNPIGNVIMNDIHKEAMCGLKAMNPRSSILSCSI